MSKRVSEEAAFVLHRYDWSESSLILEVFSRHHGRLALVAKGVKKPTSQFRPVLLPLQPLSLSWGGDAEVRTLKSAQWQGGHVMPTGDALMAGSYLNELLMRLLARDDPHPVLFDHYALAVELLAERSDATQLVLRAFELLLLRSVGLLPDLGREGSSLAVLDPDQAYTLRPEAGLSPLADEEAGQGLTGAQWLALDAAMSARDAFLATLRASMPVHTALRTQTRSLLHYHSGVRVFRTRQLMLDVQAMGRASSVLSPSDPAGPVVRPDASSPLP
ncbi:DNA repair protein RecO [Hydrogenophaga sp. NFH-34]|uniref:DNA repair protein RecO n=1 Tax=Hydrogenophaga sp. NFH-34 TaxID=2744446 RepID=UPI001F477F52|nr:DNA repair protein RecO [Hydrogenophaga sp. NFH-34]